LCACGIALGVVSAAAARTDRFDRQISPDAQRQGARDDMRVASPDVASIVEGARARGFLHLADLSAILPSIRRHGRQPHRPRPNGHARWAGGARRSRRMRRSTRARSDEHESPHDHNVGVVVIGRNEGDRLRRCFDSIPEGTHGVVYVDSGSVDGSVELARSHGFEVVALDMSRPFTAARARNSGFERLCAMFPRVTDVFFVDGDCTIAPGFIDSATALLDDRPDVVAVWGRRREVHPEDSLYNRICDIEWSQVQPGETETFGGDVLVRVAAVYEVSGYNPRIIAGEDPEFAYRLHKAGHRIVRVDADMTLHDAAILRFSQWWARTKRSGYAYAQVSTLHADEAERFWMKDKKRALLWGLIVPLSVPALAIVTLGFPSLLLGAYPLRALRVAKRARAERALDLRQAGAWALHCVGASVPQSIGILKYYVERALGRDPTLIEYK
jgi:GT2 family glycosyltransferase